jgi:CSLREA domain-containing protein
MFGRWSVRVLGALFVALVLFGSSTMASPAYAATFTVTTTADTDGTTCGATCSLRQAINAANATPDTDDIRFNIGGGGFQSIAVGAGGLPTITSPVTIDASTQPGFTGAPLIELNGAGAGNASGLTVSAQVSMIRGFVINRFSGNGVVLSGFDNHLEGNYIGTNAAGDGPGPGNGSNGVSVTGVANYIGWLGTTPTPPAQARNIISANGASGIEVRGVAAGSNLIGGNYIGTDRDGSKDLGNGFNGVWIVDAPVNIVGGTLPEERNVISGNGHHGVDIGGITATGNKIQGNYIGTDKDGKLDLGNDVDGIQIFDAYANVVGGTNAGERNVIVGNGGDGIQIQNPNAMENIVQGNYIGLGADGSTIIKNAGAGVRMYHGANRNTIGNPAFGPTASGARNVISGNDTGVNIEHAESVYNVVAGNYIGTDATGLLDRGNDRDGVFVTNTTTNQIGGLTDLHRNVISGNGRNGVRVDTSATFITIQGNYIGPKANGLEALGNSGDGVALLGQNNQVGGSSSAARNVIGGNVLSGLTLFGGASTGNLVQGNYLGVGANGTTAVGNGSSGGSGVSAVGGAHNNSIGGTDAGAGNTIANNHNLGVYLFATAGVGNAVQGNSIFANGQLGIDIHPSGSTIGTVTPNDPRDVDSGPNGLQNFPVLTGAANTASFTGIIGTLNSTPNTSFRIEFFANQTCDPSGNGEGQIYLGYTNAGTDANGDVDFGTSNLTDAPDNSVFTATATDSNGNTSEFSACFTIVPPAVNVTQSGGSTAVTEGGATDTLSISLASDTGLPVTVIFDTGFQLQPIGAIAFTPGPRGSWSQPQTVTVAAFDDGVAEGAHTGTIGFRVSGGEYSNLSVPSVTVNITDNDTAGVTITQTGGSTEVAEGGATDTLSIVLTSQPSAPVTVRFDTGSQLWSINPITFNGGPGGGWDQPRTVTVTAFDDGVAEGPHTGAITLTTTSNDPYYNNLTIPSLSVSIADNDTAGITITQTGGTTEVAEGGGFDAFSVVLASQPTADVTVTLNPDSQVRVSPPTLTFRTADWNRPQAVNVAAVDDGAVEGTHTGTIAVTTASSDSAYNNVTVPSVTVSITDNDMAGITVDQSGGSTAVAEGGATDAISVVLTSQPASDVTVSFNTGTQLQPISGITFTGGASGNWDRPQVLTVAAVDDGVVEGAHTGTITFTVSSTDTNFSGFTIPSLSVSIADNDMAGITITQTGGSTAVAEGGATDTFDVVLTSQPSADVALALNPGSQISASPTSLTFTSANWNTAKTVTVSAVDDTVAEGAHTGAVAFTVTTTDPAYKSVAIPDLSVAITDNDMSGIVVSPTSGLVTTEAGGTATFTVKLATVPTHTVTIGLSSSDTTEGTVSPASLTFQPNDTALAPQTVTVKGVDDSVDDGDIAYTIVTAPTVSEDKTYSGVNPLDVSVTNTDNDDAPAPVIPTLSINDVTVPEGNSGTTNALFTVTLSTASNQTVTVVAQTANGTAQAGSDYTTVGPTKVTFSPGTTTQSIAVPVLGDNAVEPNETFTVKLSTPTNATIRRDQGTGTITNDDVAPTGGAVLSIADVSVQEGDGGKANNAVFSVTLTPANTQTITVVAQTADGTAKSGSDYTAAGPITLTFTPGTTTQTVSVPIVGDTQAEPDETFTVKLTGPTNATIGRDQATGTIVNDDAAAPVHCQPRPPVVVTTSPATQSTASTGNGSLLVTITATTNAGTPTNAIQRIEWGQFANASVTMPGSGGGNIVKPAAHTQSDIGAQSVTVVVTRTENGKPLTVPLTVYDTCGAWPTFVGGGSGAF